MYIAFRFVVIHRSRTSWKVSKNRIDLSCELLDKTRSYTYYSNEAKVVVLRNLKALTETQVLSKEDGESLLLKKKAEVEEKKNS